MLQHWIAFAVAIYCTVIVLTVYCAELSPRLKSGKTLPLFRAVLDRAAHSYYPHLFLKEMMLFHVFGLASPNLHSGDVGPSLWCRHPFALTNPSRLFADRNRAISILAWPCQESVSR